MNSANCLKEPVSKKGNHTDLLRKIVIFKDLSQKSLQVIEKNIQTFSYKKGKQIISEDDAARGVYFVHSGAVKLTNRMRAEMK